MKKLFSHLFYTKGYADMFAVIMLAISAISAGTLALQLTNPSSSPGSSKVASNESQRLAQTAKLQEGEEVCKSRTIASVVCDGNIVKVKNVIPTGFNEYYIIECAEGLTCKPSSDNTCVSCVSEYNCGSINCPTDHVCLQNPYLSNPSCEPKNQSTAGQYCQSPIGEPESAACVSGTHCESLRGSDSPPICVPDEEGYCSGNGVSCVSANSCTGSIVDSTPPAGCVRSIEGPAVCCKTSSSPQTPSAPPDSFFGKGYCVAPDGTIKLRPNEPQCTQNPGHFPEYDAWCKYFWSNPDLKYFTCATPKPPDDPGKQDPGGGGGSQPQVPARPGKDGYCAYSDRSNAKGGSCPNGDTFKQEGDDYCRGFYNDRNMYWLECLPASSSGDGGSGGGGTGSGEWNQYCKGEKGGLKKTPGNNSGYIAPICIKGEAKESNWQSGTFKEADARAGKYKDATYYDVFSCNNAQHDFLPEKDSKKCNEQPWTVRNVNPNIEINVSVIPNNIEYAFVKAYIYDHINKNIKGRATLSKSANNTYKFTDFNLQFSNKKYDLFIIVFNKEEEEVGRINTSQCPNGMGNWAVTCLLDLSNIQDGHTVKHDYSIALSPAAADGSPGDPAPNPADLNATVNINVKVEPNGQAYDKVIMHFDNMDDFPFSKNPNDKYTHSYHAGLKKKNYNVWVDILNGDKIVGKLFPDRECQPARDGYSSCLIDLTNASDGDVITKNYTITLGSPEDYRLLCPDVNPDGTKNLCSSKSSSSDEPEDGVRGGVPGYEASKTYKRLESGDRACIDRYQSSGYSDRKYCWKENGAATQPNPGAQDPSVGGVGEKCVGAGSACGPSSDYACYNGWKNKTENSSQSYCCRFSDRFCEATGKCISDRDDCGTTGGSQSGTGGSQSGVQSACGRTGVGAGQNEHCYGGHNDCACGYNCTSATGTGESYCLAVSAGSSGSLCDTSKGFKCAKTTEAIGATAACQKALGKDFVGVDGNPGAHNACRTAGSTFCCKPASSTQSIASRETSCSTNMECSQKKLGNVCVYYAGQTSGICLAY